MPVSPSVLPIDFNLFNSNDEPVLYITEGTAGQDLVLEIYNRSDRAINAKSLTGNVHVDRHHFQLVFRPGVLLLGPEEVSLESDQFTFYAGTPIVNVYAYNDVDGTSSLYFKAPTGWSLPTGDKLVLKIKNIRVESLGGSRGTRVMLKYKNLLHQGSTEPFVGHKERHLNIINHEGRQRAPFHLGFVGHNTVLNNGTHVNQLRLRVTNKSGENHALSPGANAKLRVVLEGGPITEPWTLATNHQLTGVTMSAIYPGGNPQEIPKVSGASQWELSFNTLQQDQYIDILIQNLVTDHPNGQSTLTLYYENIANYRDGELTATIVRSPMIFHENTVGIGTTETGPKLVVAVPENERGFEIHPATGGKTFMPWSNGWNYIGGHGTIFRSKDEVEKVRIDTTNGSLAINTEHHGNTNMPWTDGWHYISGQGVILRSAEHAPKVWFDLGLGTVGIGTGNPQKRLHIAAASTEDSGIRIERSGVAFWDIDVEHYGDRRGDLSFTFNGGLAPGQRTPAAWIDNTGAYNRGSDAALKRDIQPVGSLLDKVLQLQPCTYRWKADDASDSPQVLGFVAQEVEKLFPEFVKTNGNLKGLQYDNFAVVAIRAIQEQQQLIEQLQARLDTLTEEG